MCQRIYNDYYKTSLTFSDLRKFKSLFIYRIIPSSVKNQFYLHLTGSSFTCCTRNYSFNQIIYFVATHILF